MRYVSQFDLLQIRTRLQTGARQTFDVMNSDALQSALAAPRQTLFGEEMREGAAAKGAVLFIRLIENHPFYDGDKRIAVEAVRLFLARNNLEIQATDHDLLRLARDVATNAVDEAAVADWITERTTA